MCVCVTERSIAYCVVMSVLSSREKQLGRGGTRFLAIFSARPFCEHTHTHTRTQIVTYVRTHIGTQVRT